MTEPNRREYQRLRLAKPLLGMLNSENVLILDIGLGGALVEHHGILARGRKVRLLYRWRGHDVEFSAEVARSEITRGDDAGAVSHTGLHFLEPFGDSERLLGDMMASLIGDILVAQRLNASGEREDGLDPLSEIGGARRSRARGYVMYRLGEEGNWLKTMTRSPQQPRDGFTVAQYEDESDLLVLCRAWEVGDAQSRNLIRLLAEMSVRTVKKV
jgi:hypothetical protein